MKKLRRARLDDVCKFLLFLLCLLLASAIIFALVESPATDSVALPSSPTRSPAPLTVVIDAGHGGEDGGAASESGMLEKDLNLSVAKRLASLLRCSGARVVMTREEDVLLYDRTVDYKGRKKQLDLLARREIAENTPGCIFVSIHMNAFPQQEYHGLQVWYSTNHKSSRPLAECIQKNTATHLQPDNQRICKSSTSSIYLLHHLTVPAVLVECGFLSNAEEAERLSSPEYQMSLALVLYASILQTFPTESMERNPDFPLDFITKMQYNDGKERDWSELNEGA